MRGRVQIICLVGALLVTAVTSGNADTIQDKFQGIWAAAGVPCDKVFTKNHGQVSFIRYHGAKAPGLIVKGDKVQGSQATCKLLSSKGRPDGLTLVLGCREEIIFDKMVVHVRAVSNDELVRFDPAVPEIETTYRRCRM